MPVATSAHHQKWNLNAATRLTVRVNLAVQQSARLGSIIQYRCAEAVLHRARMYFIV